MKIVARQRLLAALRPQKQQCLQLTAVAQRQNIAIAGLQKLPGKLGGVRQARLAQHHRSLRRHRPELADRRALRHSQLLLVNEQRRTLAREEVHLLDVERGAQALAHHRDQLVHVMERGQLLGEIGHRSPVPIALAIDEHLDD